MKNQPEDFKYTYQCPDPHLNITYHLYSNFEMESKTVQWAYVSKFTGGRLREMGEEYYLKGLRVVRLAVLSTELVEPLDNLPTLDQLKKLQNQPNRRKIQLTVRSRNESQKKK